MILNLLIILFGLLSVAAIVYTLIAAILVARMTRRPQVTAAQPEPVTILKPLYGAEPQLVENLGSFLTQNWDAPIQLVCGVHSEADGAFPAVQALRERHPGADVACVVDATPHGANGKIGNLINMMPAAKHDIVILSDSDMVAPPDYLDQIVDALGRPGVGAVTCLYRGRGDAGFWSRVGAAGLSWQFLPGVIVSLAVKTGNVCMGSTIAMRRATLDRIGGFDRFANILADDHAIGAAVRELGLGIVLPVMVMPHASTDTDLRALARHELRWAATVRRLHLPGYVGMIVTHPLPLALLTAVLSPLTGLPLLAAATAVRLLLIREVDRFSGASTAPPHLLPLRDMLSFFVFLGGFVTGSVDWRGERLRMDTGGRISADAEI